MNQNSDIVQRVRDILDVREENGTITENELYRLLEKSRNNFHPDKTTNEDSKEVYNEKFKELTSLLREFGEYISKKPIKTSADLANYDKHHVQNIELKHQILLLKERINNLEKDIKEKESKISKLNDEAKVLRDKKIEEETNKLLDLYKPKRINIYAIGLVAFLGLFLNILVQIEGVSKLFSKYTPFLNELSITYITLGLLAFFSLIICRKYFQEKAINKLLEKANLSTFQGQLFIGEGSLSSYSFDENGLTNILSKKIKPQSPLSRIYQLKVLGIDFDTVVENIKNIIIYNLLNKNLIYPAGQRGLFKEFRSKEYENYD